MNSDERMLIVRAQGGDVDAFSTLVESHWNRLVRFARSLVGDADAEDLVQDGMIKAWEKLINLRDPAAFHSWMMRIVSRQCFSRVRRRRQLMPIDSVKAPPDPSAAGGIESVNVERVLAILPPRQRAVMHLTVIEGMVDSEIAAVLRITAASVRSHRRRARELLDKLLRSPRPNVGEIHECIGE